LNKNIAVAAVAGAGGGTIGGSGNVVVVENLHAHHPLINHPLTLPLPPPHPHAATHHPLGQLESMNHQFSDQMLDQNAFDAHQAAVNSQQLNHQLNHQAAGLESSNVVSFEVSATLYLALR